MKTETQQEVKLVTINLNEIRFINLNGQDGTPQDLVPTLGNALYTSPMPVALTIELEKIIKGLHSGSDVEVNAKELGAIVKICHENEFYSGWAQLELIKYFTNKLNTIQDGN